jgi:hypothetical protein
MIAFLSSVSFARRLGVVLPSLELFITLYNVICIMDPDGDRNNP